MPKNEVQFALPGNSEGDTNVGKMIELTASDGHKLSAYRAEPKGKPRGGLIVVQEIFGVNGHIRSVADGYAADGYLAVAPAFFDRVERGLAHAGVPAQAHRVTRTIPSSSRRGGAKRRGGSSNRHDAAALKRASNE